MEILDRINTNFNGKYDFLRVQSVKYSTRSFLAEIVFLYPENHTTLSDDEKLEIADFVKSQLSLGCEVKIKFKKSYLDEPLIKKGLHEFLKSSYPSMFAYYDDNNIVVNKTQDDDISIQISLLDVVYKYFIDNKVKEKILAYLNNNFIAHFSIEFIQSDKSVDEQLLKQHEENVYQNLPKQKEVERYPVLEPELLCGQEITPMPEPIKNQPDSKISVILAGQISNLVDKTYISKRNKLKGIDEPSHYLTFTLTDHTGSIDAIYFANKTTYKKVCVLKDGDKILVVGDIKKDYEKKKVHIRRISFCKIDTALITQKKDEPKVEEPINNNAHIDEYKFVHPMPYILDEQVNLFDVKPNYSDYVMSHSFVVFDCETTGLSCDYNEIIEIGAVKIVDGLIKEQFQTFIHPEKEIPQEITQLTTITNEMVENAPLSAQAITDFYKFCEGCVLVGYNVSFDLGFIQNAAKKARLHFSNDSVDAMEIVRKKMYLSRYKLINVVDALGLSLKNAHRAIADAIATAEVFLKLNEVK